MAPETKEVAENKDSTSALLRTPHYWVFGLAIAVLPPLVTSMFTYQASREDSVATYKSTQKAVGALQEEQVRLLKELYKLEAEVEFLRLTCAPVSAAHPVTKPSLKMRMSATPETPWSESSLAANLDAPEPLMPPNLDAAKLQLRRLPEPGAATFAK